MDTGRDAAASMLGASTAGGLLPTLTTSNGDVDLSIGMPAMPTAAVSTAVLGNPSASAGDIQAGFAHGGSATGVSIDGAPLLVDGAIPGIVRSAQPLPAAPSITVQARSGQVDLTYPGMYGTRASDIGMAPVRDVPTPDASAPPGGNTSNATIAPPGGNTSNATIAPPRDTLMPDPAAPGASQSASAGTIAGSPQISTAAAAQIPTPSISIGAKDRPSSARAQSVAGKSPQISLKAAASPANNNSTVQTQQESRVVSGAGQNAEANDPAKAAVKNAHGEIDPKSGPLTQEHGKKSVDSFDAAIADAGKAGAALESSTRAGATEAKPLTQAERDAVVRQVADQLGAGKLTAGDNQVTVKLHPDNWGSVDVRISLNPASQPGGSAQVTAHLVAESASVKAALESHMGDLRKALEGSGLHLQDAVVSVQAASASAQSGSAGTGAGPGSHNHAGQWDAGSRTADGGQPGAGGSASFTGSGGEGRGNSRPQYQSAVDPIETQIPPIAAAVTNGRLDTRA